MKQRNFLCTKNTKKQNEGTRLRRIFYYCVVVGYNFIIISRYKKNKKKVQRDRNLKILQNLLRRRSSRHEFRGPIKCPFYIYFSNAHTPSMILQLSSIVNLCCEATCDKLITKNIRRCVNVTLSVYLF